VIVISTSTRCNCGQFVSVRELWHNQWEAFCLDCLDGADDSAERGKVRGHAETPAEALWSWATAHEEAWGIHWSPARLFDDIAAQVSAEFARQSTWLLECPNGKPVEFCTNGEELVYGPLGAEGLC
jgi:hypothetical protein